MVAAGDASHQSPSMPSSQRMARMRHTSLRRSLLSVIQLPLRACPPTCRSAETDCRRQAFKTCCRICRVAASPRHRHEAESYNAFCQRMPDMTPQRLPPSVTHAVARALLSPGVGVV